MNITQALILGIVQGITEFFPISSSGHLVLLQSLFGLKEPQIAFDIFLHFGTLVAIVIFFCRDILRLFTSDKRLLYFLVIASVPTAIIGFLFKDVVEKFFGMPKVVGYMLLITGLWLSLASLYIKRIGTKKDLGVANSLIIGVAQGIAVMPGISRSGATIATGIMTGLDKELSFRFSFLLAIPALLGATALKINNIKSGILGNESAYFLIGAITSMIMGLITINVLLKLVRKNQLYLFGIYCILIGFLTILLIR